MTSTSLTHTFLAHLPHAQAWNVTRDLTDKVEHSATSADGFFTAELLADVLHYSKELKEEASKSSLEEKRLIVLHFLLRCICNATESANLESLRFVSRFCVVADRDYYLRSILCAVISCLSKEVNQPLKKVDGSAALSERSLYLSQKIIDLPSENATQVQLNPDECLSFLKVFSWEIKEAKPLVEGCLLETIFTLVFLLIGHSSTETSLLATRAILSILKNDALQNAFLTSWSTECTQPQSNTLMIDFIWQRLLELTRGSNEQKREYISHGLSIWLQIISLSRKRFLLLPFLGGETYWERLYSKLSYGTSQQRKLALEIVQQSIAKCQSDIDTTYISFTLEHLALYQSQFGKFRVLFETIVLGGYLGQIAACLGDLSRLLLPGSKLDKSWVLALLTAGIDKEMQDSVRKILGTWAFDHIPPICCHCPNLAIEFIEKRFLPWIFEGRHFTSTISRDNGVTCEHGEKVVMCLRTSVRSMPNDGHRRLLIQASLRFLLDRASTIFPFSRAYILEGIVACIEDCDVSLESDEVDMTKRLSEITGFPVIVQEYMDFMLERIARATVNKFDIARETENMSIAKEVAQESTVPEEPCAEAIVYDLAQNHAASLGYLLDDVKPLSSSPLSWLHHMLISSRHRCLWGPGLRAACLLLVRTFESSRSTTEDTAVFCNVLEAIWEQTEIQDFPREVVMILPRLLLHINTIKLCLPGSRLLEVISIILQKLQQLTESRIYVFAPFAEALRLACLTIPESIHLPVEEILYQFLRNPPCAKIEFILELAIAVKLQAWDPNKTYYSFYGKSESYGHACMFDLINKLPTTPEWLRLGRSIFDRLLATWVNQKLPIPAVSRWKTTAQLQAVLILSERCLLATEPLKVVETYIESLLTVLSGEPLPRFRFLLEWTIGNIYAKSGLNSSKILQVLDEGDMANPKYLISIQKIATMLALYHDNETFGVDLMKHLMIMSASPKVAVRHASQWAMISLWDRAMEKNWLGILNNDTFSLMNSSIRRLESYQRPPEGRLLENFDLLENHTVTYLLQGLYLDIEPSEMPTATREDFIQLDSEIGTLPLGPRIGSRVGSKDTAGDLDYEAPKDNRLQRKSLTLPKDLSSYEGTEQVSQKRHGCNVIVIASLIESLYNLGGLSRAAEIMGVRSMQINRLEALRSKEFLSTSVSSHLWLTIEQLQVDGITDFITRHRMEGYSIVGVEQTDSSIILGKSEWRVPEKIVLLLGSEKEGIPANLLAEIDACVEIEQHGVTRSMNIQTAASIVLYEISRQHRI